MCETGAIFMENGEWTLHFDMSAFMYAYRVWSEQLCWSRICNELRPVPPEELKWEQQEYHPIERETKFMVKMKLFSDKIS